MQETIHKQFWKEEKWASEHMAELQKKYENKWIAIVNNKVEGVGDNAAIAMKQAKEKTHAKEDFLVIFIESGQNLY